METHVGACDAGHSLRYKERMIHQFFDDLATREENPLKLDNVVVFVGECDEGNPDH
jgi:hypothetical protein